MSAKTYIQVIVPLKLDWEPVYSVPEGLAPSVGDRVSVLFSGKEYLAVVSKTGVTPREGLREEDILPVLDQEVSLPRITELEMRFWRILASYYLCTVGEVYKSVYFLDQKPPRKWAGRDRNAIGREPVLSGDKKRVFEDALQALSHKKTVLLEADDRVDIYMALAVDTVKKGKSVLYLVPEVAFSDALEQRLAEVFPDVMLYHSGLTPAKKRDVVLEARAGKPMVVLGTRSSIWIPFSNLGLVIVDYEQDPSFKQDSPAPRFVTRDSAILLASLCGANVVLGSPSPSFESIYNSETGIFTRLKLNEHLNIGNRPSSVILDIVSERKKRAVAGSFSLKLIAHLKDAVDSGKKVLVVCPSKSGEEDCRKELDGIFPGALDTSVFTVSPAGVKTVPEGVYSVIAVLLADVLLGRDDFRSDERAVQMFTVLRSKTELLVIQTREPGHPVFSGESAQMMQERMVAGYPPFTRLVSVAVKDVNEQRLTLRSRFLCNRLKEVLRPFSNPQILGPLNGEIRIFFKRDKNLQPGKQALYHEVMEFEKQYSYAGHITIDVDPV